MQEYIHDIHLKLDMTPENDGFSERVQIFQIFCGSCGSISNFNGLTCT